MCGPADWLKTPFTAEDAEDAEELQNKSCQSILLPIELTSLSWVLFFLCVLRGERLIFPVKC